MQDPLVLGIGQASSSTTWAHGSNLAHRQGSPNVKCPHPRAVAPPKLKLTIFSLTILSIPNTSQQKDNPIPLSLPLQLSMARAGLPLHYSNP